ncbi:hypothetical protein ETAA8_01890 [Anatilimnocola aggregata]|uniref:Uncharacterized protein n=1 Tax=Anatilimnocola aggregata TaxID=2528021 RepID=A0A517Y4E9_9BACT|nr:hypothetical protein ETAA8_01890 [Anatilimnocola aggregata]
MKLGFRRTIALNCERIAQGALALCQHFGSAWPIYDTQSTGRTTTRRSSVYGSFADQRGQKRVTSTGHECCRIEAPQKKT